MNTGERHRQDGPQAEVAGGDHGVFPGRALPVVGAGDHQVSAAVPAGQHPLRVAVIELAEGEFGELGDVAAIRQHPRARRQDFVGGHVVADLERDRRLDPVGQRTEIG